MTRFNLALVAVVLTVLAIVVGLSKATIIVLPSFFLETTLLLGLTTWVVFKRIHSIVSPETFATAYLASIVLQLLLWLGYLATIFYLDKSGIIPNTIHFLANCLIFISLEVGFLFITRRQ